MLISVLGATGPSGIHFVRQALDAGHSIRALVRNPDKFDAKLRERPNLEIRGGVDVYDVDNLSEGFEGVDAVVSCLGAPVSLTPIGNEIRLHSESIKSISTAMRRREVNRLVVLSSWYTDDHPSYGFFVRWLLKPLFIGRNLDDMGRMEQFLENECQELNYTVVRLPGLADKTTSPTTEGVAETVGSQFVPGKSPGKMTERADVAKFLLKTLTTDDYNRQIVAIAT